MVGCIKAISPCVKSASAKLFLDLHTMSAPSGEECTLDAAGTGRTRCAMLPPLQLCTVGCTVGAQLKRQCQKPQGRACAAAPALRDILVHTLYYYLQAVED